MAQIINNPNGGINGQVFKPTLADILGIDTRAQIDPRESQGFPIGGGQPIGCGVVGCWGKDSMGRTTLNGQVFESNVNSNEVTCADGTKDISNGAVSPCGGHGGVNPIPTQENNANETFIQKHKNHLLIAGALVLGYLAYKKFNK
jgi:hypothetical protein